MKKNIIQINKRIISKDSLPLVIVELGINHSGQLKLAKKLINDAKKAGAEIVKHQTHMADKEMSEEAKTIKPDNANTSIYDVIKNNSLSFDQEKKIRDYAKKLKLEFISTPFSREAAKKLFKIGVPAFKIGSGECNNLPLVEYICKFKKPIFLSTGMNDIASIKKTVKIIEKYKVPYAIFHCTNIYPTPYNLVRLNALKEIKKAFPKAILGLSDHTGDNYTSFAAVALGATVIEKHFIDTKKRKGPDISASIDKTQLKDLIEGVRKIYLSLPGKKKALKEEKSTINFAFASVVSIKKIKKGEKFSYKNTWVKRPGNGDFKASEIGKILGKIAINNIKQNTQIKKRDVFK